MPDEINDVSCAMSKERRHELEKKLVDLLPYIRSLANGSEGLAERYSIDEIVQETCHRALNDLHRFQDIPGVTEGFIGWIKAITQNRISDAWRKVRRGSHILAQDLGELHLPDNDLPTPSRVARLKETAKAVNGLLQSSLLSARDKEIVMDHYYKGNGTEEIAEKFGMSTSAVNTCLSRAVKELRSLAGNESKYSHKTNKRFRRGSRSRQS